MKWLVVGAGLTGITLAERIAHELRHKVVVIDRHDHVGGHAADYLDPDGLRIHRYGPHIFHTSRPDVWQYLSRFTCWINYTHYVQANVDGSYIPLPVSLASLPKLTSVEKANLYARELLADYGMNATPPIFTLRQSNNPAIRELAALIYEKIFYGYSCKQWGISPDNLADEVTARVPVRVNDDTRYFTDPYQGIPADGYCTLCERMLDHPNITVHLNTQYHESMLNEKKIRVIFTGPIDEFFDYRLGHLPYRSINFASRNSALGSMQRVAVVNYPDISVPYTRVTDWKHLMDKPPVKTRLTYEYPCAHEPGITNPFYPIPSPSTETLYQQYLDLTKPLINRVLFAGRLGSYRYLNMDAAVAQALSIFKTEVAHCLNES